MPDSRKPPRKAAARRMPSDASLMPDQRTMESVLAAISGDAEDDALSQAQTVMYDAWERSTARARIALARKALMISPLCADAYNLLASEAKTPREARGLYVLGVEAGEKTLGPKGFEDFDGLLWGFLETRPYMRARHGLALSLLQLGDEDGALAHFRGMLKLNPGDNQGIRYLMLATQLRRGDAAGMKSLIKSYPDEWSANWLYTRLLLAYRDGDAAKPATLKLAREARSANRHVPAILNGTTPPVPSTNGYITVGGPDEATEYVREFGPAWKETQGAIEWLVTATEAAPSRRRATKIPSKPH